MRIPITRLLELTGGSLFLGDGHMTFDGFATLEEAGPSELCFFHDARYRAGFMSTRAGTVLVPDTWRGSLPPLSVCIIGVPDPSRAFELAVERWGVQPETFTPGVHPSATISPEALFDPSVVAVGPQAVISAGVTLGAGTVVGAGCFLGPGVRLGAGCLLHAGVTVQSGCLLGDRVILHPGVVIGADGFGYAPSGAGHRKVRQAGIVQIEDDVEIGANTAVDRARFGRTWIRCGTKIDNLVQIGHNAVIGRHCLIAAGSAVAGSAVLEDHVTVAGQCGIAGHVRVGSRSVLGARSGVTRGLPGGEFYMGFPAQPAGAERRSLALTRRLPALMRRVRELEDRLSGMERDKERWSGGGATGEFEESSGD